MTPEAFSVESALDSFVQSVEKPRPPDGRWHPSSLYGCARKAVYEVRGVPETDPRDSQSRRVLRVGHILHEFVQDAVEQQIGGSISQAYREVPVEIPEYNLVGTGDGLIEFASGFWELQEYKSISSQAFKYKKKGQLPKADHVGQVTPYIYSLQRYGSPALGIPPLGESLTRARVTYVSKDDLEISEHTVILTEAKIADLETRVSQLNPFREGTALPARLPLEVKTKKRNWACGYCQFATRCWERDGEDVQSQ